MGGIETADVDKKTGADNLIISRHKYRCFAFCVTVLALSAYRALRESVSASSQLPAFAR